MLRSKLIAAAVVVACASGLVAWFAMTRESRRGTLLITLDTVRADHLSSYGYQIQTTPFIDSLAREGVLFEQAMSAASNTPVSHAAMLTGLYPPRNGLRFIHGYDAHKLADGITSLVETYAGAGYRTAAFLSAFPLTADRTALNRGFAIYDDGVVTNSQTAITKEGFVMIKENQRAGGQTIDRFIEWLSRERPERFFAWIHLFDAHDSIIMPPEDYEPGFDPTRKGKRRHGYYDVEIAYMDLLLKQMMQRMGEVFPADRIQVAITADHGDGLGEHNYERHTGRIYQEQLHVPLVIKSTDLHPGIRIGSTVRTVDIIPTLLELDGLPVPDGIDGKSLLPLIKGTESEDRVCYAETLAAVGANERPWLAIIKNRRKLICSPLPEPAIYELYDLKADPEEANNIWGAAGTDGIAKELLDELNRFPLKLDFKKKDDLSEADKEKLRALGYL